MKSTISVSSDAPPTLTRNEQGSFTLAFDQPDIHLELVFDAAHIKTIGLLCQHHFPDIEPRFVVASEEDAYRLLAREIGLLDDRSVQVLITEISSNELILFLWYMMDEKLASLILNNMSRRAAAVLLEDLIASHGHHHPDRVSIAYIQKARKVTLKIISILERLRESGRIQT